MIESKSEVFKIFKQWKLLVENQLNSKLKILRTDNGGEYTSTVFENYLVANGVIHEKSIPKTPEQNGIAERLNRTLLERVRTMLSHSQLAHSFWAEALSTAVYVRNRCPTKLLNITPYEALLGNKPDISHLRVFGCNAYAHIPSEERRKLDSKSKFCKLLGYGANVKVYRLYDVEKKRVIHSRNVVFHENKFDKKIENSQKSNRVLPVSLCDSDSDSEFEPQLTSDTVSLPVETHDSEAPLVRMSGRASKPPNYYGEWTHISKCETPLPSNIEEALSGPEAILWQKAVEQEL